MLANLSKLKTINPIWALIIIASAALIIVAGCISTERSVKKVNKTEVPQVIQKQVNIPETPQVIQKQVNIPETPQVIQKQVNIPETPQVIQKQVNIPRVPQVTSAPEQLSLPEVAPRQGVAPGVDQEQLQIIGKKIFQNETGGKLKNLIFWSPNEDFASLGVGHFIWFPEGRSQGFTESFPSMIRYLQDNGVAVPAWLSRQIQIGALWNSKQQLEQERSSPKFLELQQLLIDTSGLQVSFLFQRLDQALPKMLLGRSPEKRELISRRFNTVKSSPGGLYPLVDYVNFKGEGVVTSEKHNGVGWGLLQVLELMEPTPIGVEALKEFAIAAELVLMRRVANAPIERNEQRWLPGWRVRLRTYYL